MNPGANTYKKAAAAVILGAAALSLSHRAVAYECPWSANAVCAKRFVNEPWANGQPATCYGNGVSLGSVSCLNRSFSVNPPTQNYLTSATLTATNTVDVQGRRTCKPMSGGVSQTGYWTAQRIAPPQPPNVVDAPGCAANSISMDVACRGINALGPCN